MQAHGRQNDHAQGEPYFFHLNDLLINDLKLQYQKQEVNKTIGHQPIGMAVGQQQSA